MGETVAVRVLREELRATLRALLDTDPEVHAEARALVLQALRDPAVRVAAKQYAEALFTGRAGAVRRGDSRPIDIMADAIMAECRRLEEIGRRAAVDAIAAELDRRRA